MQVIDWKYSEVICNVMMGTLNPTHSLTHSVYHSLSHTTHQTLLGVSGRGMVVSRGSS